MPLTNPEDRPLLAPTEDRIHPEQATHGQHVSWTSAYMLCLSCMVGSGVFAIPGIVARTAGSPGLSLLAWLLGALIATCHVVVALEYGCMLPRSGGEKVYLEYTYQRPRWLASTIYAFKMVTQLSTANNCIVFGEYLTYALFTGESPVAKKTAALGLLGVSAVLHGCFLKTGIWVQDMLGWCKIGLMVFMTLTAFFTVMSRGGPPADSVPPESISNIALDNPWQGSNWGWEVISLAFFKVQFAYDGVANVGYVLNEVQDPIRMLKRITPLAILSVCLLYLLWNTAIFLVVPLDEMKQSGEMAAALFFRRLFGDKLGGIVMPLLVAISTAGSVMVWIFTTSRINQEIARQGFLPIIFASSEPFHAPLGGVIVNFIPAALLILILPSSDVYSFILSAEGYLNQWRGVALAAGLILLRYKQPDLARPFLAWMPVVWFWLAQCICLALAPFVPFAGKQGEEVSGVWHGAYALVGLGLIAAATLYWAIWAKMLPALGRYSLEEKRGVLRDGTTYISIVRTPDHQGLIKASTTITVTWYGSGHL